MYGQNFTFAYLTEKKVLEIYLFFFFLVDIS